MDVILRNALIPHRVEICMREEHTDPKAHHLLHSIREFFKIPVEKLQIVRFYQIHKKLTSSQVHALTTHLLLDPILEIGAEKKLPLQADWAVEVQFKPGVTDTAGKTARTTIEDFLKAPFETHEEIYSGWKYLFSGTLSKDQIEKIALQLLANPLIEDVLIFSMHSDKIETISLVLSDEELIELSQRRHLALTLQEMKEIKKYFDRPEIKESRSLASLSLDPTDVELEAIAQTWSEHCKHKIFNAKISYKENGNEEEIDSLFHTYIVKATEELSEEIDWLVSIFKDNAGIIRFNESWNLAFKVETHNSPSALDPYGGALTGVLGVNRDILGAGLGARLIANTDILCFAPPDFSAKIPQKLLHPKRILEGVCRGIEHAGNKSGIPTVNGSITFDDRYLGKPLVYCGSIGIMPCAIQGEKTHEKKIYPGNLIIIAGGRTGKDGIHGATFSSEGLTESSPTTAVQIGDPFTQKKLQDFLLQARDLKLYNAITDNGAGGLSSSVGEMARFCGGCEIELDRVLLKQANLSPWEILLSESQERMTLAVSSDKVQELYALAHLHEVELVTIGNFVASGNFHVLFKGKTVALLHLDFLHEGVPQLNLKAEWAPKKDALPKITPTSSYEKELLDILSRYNVCSKEYWVRQFDHEVQGATCLKPFTGLYHDGPSDAAILKPLELLASKEALVIGHGICPKYSDKDTYDMTAVAIDEAIRNCVAVGADPSRIAILDNFSWPDPVENPIHNPDGAFKLAQLVRANKALYHYAKAFKTPIISGKDSMKNDYCIGNIKISVPPTLLISALGKIDSIDNAISMDVKMADDLIYIIGMTKNELFASEFYAMKKIEGGDAPSVNANRARQNYLALHRAIRAGMITSCHDCSDGGLAVALAESAFSGGLGMEISLSQVPVEGVLSDAEILFSESSSRLIVTLPSRHVTNFESLFNKEELSCIGKVRKDQAFTVLGKNQEPTIQLQLHTLKEAWQKPFAKRSL
ncbi:MAG TPA: phosphoribosylformylglycinamidine synthase subunit PurL [Rhabdochlamydiaceae bacterium]|nr:phosphoribosylformylglycinamidine synthase subunit PurL [Rhabdochlamydiaceae bacterium]